MHTNGHGPDVHVDASAGYETRDVALHTLVKWVVGLFIFIFLTVLLTIPLYFLLVPRDESRTARTGQNELRPTIRRPPDPVIQPKPIQDMAAFERGQQQMLTSYGRIQGEPGKVHIPIDQAMDKVLSGGLAAAPRQAPPDAPSGIYTAGDTTAAWTRNGRRRTAPGESGPAPSVPSPRSDPSRPVPNADPAPAEPMTLPQGVTEREMRGGVQNELTPQPRRDEPR